MPEPVFLPITKNDENELKVIAPALQTVLPSATTYEKVPVTDFKLKDKFVESRQVIYYDKDGNEIIKQPTAGDDIFRIRMLSNNDNIQEIRNSFKDDTYFVKKTTRDDLLSWDYSGGRKRKQSKYSSKKRSVKSRRSRNSRKRRYSRRR